MCLNFSTVAPYRLLDFADFAPTRLWQYKLITVVVDLPLFKTYKKSIFLKIFLLDEKGGLFKDFCQKQKKQRYDFFLVFKVFKHLQAFLHRLSQWNSFKKFFILKSFRASRDRIFSNFNGFYGKKPAKSEWIFFNLLSRKKDLVDSFGLKKILFLG